MIIKACIYTKKYIYFYWLITGNYYKYKNVEVFITFKSFSPLCSTSLSFHLVLFLNFTNGSKTNMLLSACLIAFTFAVVHENVSLEELFFFTLSLSTNEATLDWERFNQMELENQTKLHGYYNERAIYTLLNTLSPTKWMKCLTKPNNNGRINNVQKEKTTGMCNISNFSVPQTVTYVVIVW